MLFLPAERSILMIIATLMVLGCILIVTKGVGVDIAGYAGLLAIGVSALALGQYYRRFRPDARISATLTATGLFLVFSMAGSIFNYMLLPVRFPPIDATLSRIDAALGFDWPSFVIWISGYPLFGDLLRVVYFSSLPQLVLVILILGFFVDIPTLHRFLLTGIFGALLSILCWSLFPSFGASSVHSLPQAVLNTMPIAVGPAYGAELVRLGQEGVNYLTPRNVLGLIGFPSFHTVMACMSVCFVTRLRLVFWPLLAVNLVMVPAILVQGGHHLSDVLGGVAIFCLANLLASSLLRQKNAAAVAMFA
ncbi:phosphatase PAP2 family protein [Pararhizobium sp. O133]|uniref:phosphatase PAP2 family protein n=1 Tax=Pararhizobium sp. O133 TaxID=3449278 RepID=UPI003F6842D8